MDYLIFKNKRRWENLASVFHSQEEVVGLEYIDYVNFPKLYTGIVLEKDAWEWELGGFINNAAETKVEKKLLCHIMMQCSLLIIVFH